MESTQNRVETLRFNQSINGSSSTVRVLNYRSNSPLFIAHDILRIIGLNKGRVCLNKLDKTRKKTVVIDGRRRVMLTVEGILIITATKAITQRQKENLGSSWDLKLFAFRKWFKETVTQEDVSFLPKVTSATIPRLRNHTLTLRSMPTIVHESYPLRYRNDVTKWV